MYRNVFGVMLLLLSVAACSHEVPTAPVAVDDESPMFSPLGIGSEPVNERSVNARTWKSAYRVARAAQAFAADSDGRFPNEMGSESGAGKRFIDYFPGGELLRNAYTGYRTEPLAGMYAATPGQVGYFGIVSPEGHRVGYVISAMGATQEDYMYLEYAPE